MTRRSKIWLVVAMIFVVVNLAGAGMAAMAGEPLHTALHVGLLLAGAYAVWRLAAGRSARVGSSRSAAMFSASSGELPDRLMHLEQSVDAVAIEVERIGEGQRFMTRVLADNAIPHAPARNAAEPEEIQARTTHPEDGH